jgi:hypothetical protein
VAVRASATREEAAKSAVVGALVATLAGVPLFEAQAAYAAVRGAGLLRARAQPQTAPVRRFPTNTFAAARRSPSWRAPARRWRRGARRRGRGGLPGARGRLGAHGRALTRSQLGTPALRAAAFAVRLSFVPQVASPEVIAAAEKEGNARLASCTTSECRQVIEALNNKKLAKLRGAASRPARPRASRATRRTPRACAAFRRLRRPHAPRSRVPRLLAHARTAGAGADAPRCALCRPPRLSCHGAIDPQVSLRRP